MVEVTMDELLELVEGDAVPTKDGADSEADSAEADGRADGEVSEDAN